MYETNTTSNIAGCSRGVFSLELGMPHLGRHNLSESALFKAIGHHRWKQIEDAGGIKSGFICDEAHSRLYATFFFLEMDLPRQVPLSAFGENSCLRFNTDLTHYSKVYLDGWYSFAEHSELGIRASNVFIYQERGPSKLSLSVPINVDFSGIPELSAPPDSLDLCRNAKTNGTFFEPCAGDVALYDGEREFVYEIDADRDLNGAGLVYFANFISFLDLAERKILSTFENPMPSELLDARSTYRRRIGYFGNAKSTDHLHIFVGTKLQVVEHGDHCLLDFRFDYRILRSSDRKEIVVSSCRKIAPVPLNSESEIWVRSWTRDSTVSHESQALCTTTIE
jgi:probable biosynthetic protein (TIGR04098 family)